MGRRGPPRLPESVRRARGTLRRDRSNPAAPTLPPGEPAAPDWLTADAREEWVRIVPILSAAGLLSDSCRAALAGYCTAWGELCDARRAVAQFGTTAINSRTGLPVLSPHLRRAEKALEQIVRFGREFGLTPAAAASVKAGPTPDDRAAIERRKRFEVLSTPQRRVE